MRIATREELRMEIKKLKGRLGIKLTKEEMKIENDEENENNLNQDILKEKMSEMDGGSINGGEFEEARKRLEDSLRSLQLELRDKNETILTQREDIENLKVEIRARDMNINRMNRSIEELHNEIRDLKLLETELKQVIQKKMALEN
jgi:hypothetical protein